MTADPPLSRIQIAQRLASHFGHRDFDQCIDLLSENVTYRVGGNHALAGTFHGRDEVIAHAMDLVNRTGNTFDTFKWEDWLVGENHVATLLRAHATEHGATLELRLLVLMGFDPSDKVSEVTIFFEDASSAERFFGR
jgi:ketosteroid isomerase-like protein